MRAVPIFRMRSALGDEDPLRLYYAISARAMLGQAFILVHLSCRFRKVGGRLRTRRYQESLTPLAVIQKKLFVFLIL